MELNPLNLCNLWIKNIIFGKEGKDIFGKPARSVGDREEPAEGTDELRVGGNGLHVVHASADILHLYEAAAPRGSHCWTIAYRSDDGGALGGLSTRAMPTDDVRPCGGTAGTFGMVVSRYV